MNKLIVKLGSWLLPIALDWLYGKVQRYKDEQKAQKQRDIERGSVNARTINELERCENLEACIVAARDTYNGRLSNGP